MALAWDSPVTGRKTKYTYNQLREEVAKFAAVLDDMGVKVGGRSRKRGEWRPRLQGKQVGIRLIYVSLSSV